MSRRLVLWNDGTSGRGGTVGASKRFTLTSHLLPAGAGTSPTTSHPAVTMPYTLHCTIIGHNTIFQVDIDETQAVGEQKKGIKEEKEHSLASLDADFLMPSKVNIDISKTETVMQQIHQSSIDFGILVLGIRALRALMWRSPVPYGHASGYIRTRILDIVPLRVCSRPQQTRRFSPS